MPFQIRILSCLWNAIAFPMCLRVCFFFSFFPFVSEFFSSFLNSIENKPKKACSFCTITFSHTQCDRTVDCVHTNIPNYF